MKRVTYCLTAVIAAFVALLFVTEVVRSTDSPDPARPWYGFTRIVTITVEPASDPLTPALNSLWQMENINLITDVYKIPLPTDAYNINVKLSVGNNYDIEPGPTIVFTGSQPWFYVDYRTNQRALRVGNQILITQTAGNTQQFHYLSTLLFAEPYQYIGTSGHSPISITNPSIQWDDIPVSGPDLVHRINISTWLGDTRLTAAAGPDLEILTATLKPLSFSQARISAVIHNRGITTTVAPPYLNLYDYLAPSTPPTNPADATNSWCTLYPTTRCAVGSPDPLPILAAGDTITVWADYTLSFRSGTHDLYFLVDGLGGNLGLNWESDETNNWKLAGSQSSWRVLLPLILSNTTNE
jgi:hypothetical protein